MSATSDHSISHLSKLPTPSRILSHSTFSHAHSTGTTGSERGHAEIDSEGSSSEESEGAGIGDRDSIILTTPAATGTDFEMSGVGDGSSRAANPRSTSDDGIEIRNQDGDEDGDERLPDRLGQAYDASHHWIGKQAGSPSSSLASRRRGPNPLPHPIAPNNASRRVDSENLISRDVWAENRPVTPSVPGSRSHIDHHGSLPCTPLGPPRTPIQGQNSSQTPASPFFALEGATYGASWQQFKEASTTVSSPAPIMPMNSAAEVTSADRDWKDDHSFNLGVGLGLSLSSVDPQRSDSGDHKKSPDSAAPLAEIYRRPSQTSRPVKKSDSEAPPDFVYRKPTLPRSSMASGSGTAATPSRNVIPPPSPARVPVHSRNLSIFFPEPGKKYTEEELEQQRRQDEARRKANRLSWRLGESGAMATSPLPVPASPKPPRSPSAEHRPSSPRAPGRRGHHHRHSLSHNFFPFLDSSRLEGEGNSPANGSGPFSPPLLATPKPVASTFVGGTPVLSTTPRLPSPISDRRRSSLSPLAEIGHLTSPEQFRLLLGGLQLSLGMILWLKGQSSSHLGVTGLGYMVVFEGLGLVLGVIGKLFASAESSIKRPFGSLRRETLLYFIQSIFLFFSAVYITKEALEHVMLSSSEGHGGGSSHGHSHSRNSGDENPEYPLLLIACAGVCTLMSIMRKINHEKLIQAAGSDALSHALVDLVVSTFPALRVYIKNVYSTITLLTIAMAMLFSVVLSGEHLEKADRVLSFVEASICFYLSRPVVAALANVLMQIGPDSRSIEMIALKQALREIAELPDVVEIREPHVWQLTPHPPDWIDRSHSNSNEDGKQRILDQNFDGSEGDPVSAPLSDESRIRRKRSSDNKDSLSSSSGIIVATLEVVVRDEVVDQAVLEITRIAYQKCSKALSTSQTAGAPTAAAGEVTVRAIRERDR